MQRPVSITVKSGTQGQFNSITTNFSEQLLRVDLWYDDGGQIARAQMFHLCATSAIATLVGAQTRTRSPLPASTDSRRTIVEVLPVPGGPWQPLRK